MACDIVGHLRNERKGRAFLAMATGLCSLGYDNVCPDINGVFGVS